MEKRRELLTQIIDIIGQHAYEVPSTKLTGFVGLKGSSATERVELVIVGRAVNGWGDGCLPVSLANDNQRKDMCDSIINSAYSDIKCPMSWVSEQWHIHDGYNTRRSAFWRVIRNLTNKLNIADVENDPNWPSRLAWTNLYKISPADGGNPSEKLRTIQFEGCAKLLKYEINDWQPKRLLFLTGIDWAEPFLRHMNVLYTEITDSLYVKATATSPYPLVVAKHPQGKNETKWCEEVMQAFLEMNAL